MEKTDDNFVMLHFYLHQFYAGFYAKIEKKKKN